MSELTYQQYVDPEILDPERWIRLEDDGGILLDPATGEPMSGLPEWIEADERLQEGRDYLGSIAAKHSLTVILSPHGTRFGPGLSGRFENLVGQADACAFENLGWNRVNHDLEMGKARYERRYNASIRSWLDFETRWKAIVARENMQSFSYDPEVQSANPLDLLVMEVLMTASERMEKMPSMHRKVLKLGVHALREHYIPGKYGYELQNNRMLGAESSSVLLIGSDHLEIPSKFVDQGLESVSVERLGSKRNTFFPDTMRTGRVPLGIAYFGLGAI